MGNLKNKKNLLFDLAGTLVDLPIEPIWEQVNLQGIENIFNALALKNNLEKNLEQRYDENTLQKWQTEFVKQKKTLRKQAKKDLKEYPLQEQIKIFLQSKKIPFTQDQLKELDRQFILPELEICSLYDGVMDTLKKLKQKYKLFIITNNVSRILTEETLKEFSLEKFFTQIIVSEDSAVRKPDKNFLQPFLKNGYFLEDSIIIGDRLGQDILLAYNCNVASIHIENDHIDNQGLQGKIKADVSITRITELLELLW